MSTSSERAAEELHRTLHVTAREADAEIRDASSQRDAPRLRKRLGQAKHLRAQANQQLDALRASGYQELPDGSWRNPQGVIVYRPRPGR